MTDWIYTVSFLNGAAAIDLTLAGVSPGDYLELYRGGGTYKILDVNPTYPAITNQLMIAPIVPSDPTTGPPSFPRYRSGRWRRPVTSEYRIRRSAGQDYGRRCPDTAGRNRDRQHHLDQHGPPVTPAKCLNIPVWPLNAASSYILFSPQGGIVGRNSGSDHLCVLWLSNTNNNTTPPLLLAIQAHTGLIGVQPLANGTARTCPTIRLCETPTNCVETAGLRDCGNEGSLI